MGCGFLELPRLSGDPMRATRAAADAPEKACPHCGEQAWVPLGGDAEVRALCRPCLAWRVEVRYPGDRGRAFALVEQETAELRVDTEAIVGAVTIGGVATDVTDRAPGLRAYLCSRGLDPDDQLEIREIVLVAGDAVAMHHDRCGGPTILVRAA
jgi:hypothetical protein